MTPCASGPYDERAMAKRTYQEIILALEQYWAGYGCVLLTPYHTEVAAGTMNPATFLRSLGPEAVEDRVPRAGDPPAGRPLRREPDALPALLPVPGDPEAAAGGRARALPRVAARDRPRHEQHDIRFVEDDWEQPTVGAWGLGWEVWCDGMEITQFTYFQQLGGLELDLIPAEITYGLDRIAMVVQEKPTVFALEWAEGSPGRTSTARTSASGRTTTSKRRTSRCMRAISTTTKRSASA